MWHLWCGSYLFPSSQARHACVPQRPQRLQRTLMTLFPVYCRFLGWWQNVLGSSSCVQEWPLEEWRHCCVRFTAITGHKRGFVPHLKRFILQGHKEWALSWCTSYQYMLQSPVDKLFWTTLFFFFFLIQMCLLLSFFVITSHPSYYMILTQQKFDICSSWLVNLWKSFCCTFIQKTQRKKQFVLEHIMLVCLIIIS